MQKLLEETLLCDISSSIIDPYDYGENWTYIENRMKRIIDRDNNNQVNNKNNHKKLGLALNNSVTLKNTPTKLSPKSLKNDLKTSISSKIKTAFIKQSSAEFYLLQKANSKEIFNNAIGQDIILQEKDQRVLQKQEVYQSWQNFQADSQSIKFQQKKVTPQKYQQLPSIHNDNYSKLKTQPSQSLKKFNSQSFSQSLKIQSNNETTNKVTTCQKNKEQKSVQFADKEKQNKKLISQIQKQILEKDFQRYNYNEENLIRIEKMKILGKVHKHNIRLNQQFQSYQFRAKSENGHENYKKYRLFQQKNIKQQSNRNESLFKSTLEQTKRFNKLKVMIIQNKYSNNSQNKQTKNHQIHNSNSLKSLQQRNSIILPLIERQSSEKKLQKLITTRIKKGFSFSQSGNFPQQKIKHRSPKIKNVLNLDADRKRIQSIKLIVKKNQQLYPKRLFEQIKMEQRQDEGGILRKMTMSQFFRKITINGGQMNLHKDGTNDEQLFDRKKYSKSLELQTQVSKRQNFQQRKIKNCSRSLISVNHFAKNKNDDVVQNPIIHSSPKQSKGKRDGKQNSSSKQKNIKQRNVPPFKIQSNKNRSKLLIVKR